jgi:hypothetical protein
VWTYNKNKPIENLKTKWCACYFLLLHAHLVVLKVPPTARRQCPLSNFVAGAAPAERPFFCSRLYINWTPQKKGCAFSKRVHEN